MKKSNPTGPMLGSDRAYRGGFWYDPAWFCRSAYRCGIDPLDWYSFLGFRVVALKRSARDEKE